MLTGRHRSLEGEERKLYNFIDRYSVGLIFLGDQFLTNFYFSIKAAKDLTFQVLIRQKTISILNLP
ncbi:MAG: hypothetical protein DWQ54_08555 [Microcystis flos-aquae TF09]|uniref:Uncharacterized protein n=1 Tax=Microcystis flos-aquae TF09 TaxID=2060473 RepID=A0A3E0L613_9CHRO|nr:MAG: hypothetical protein DWQ54_08555 [Microcystis flos-aquae TF09]